MKKLSFFKGLSLALFLSAFLWTGIIYAVNQFFEADSIEEDTIERTDKPTIRYL